MPGPKPPQSALTATASSNSSSGERSFNSGSSKSLAANAAAQHANAKPYRSAAGTGAACRNSIRRSICGDGCSTPSGRLGAFLSQAKVLLQSLDHFAGVSLQLGILAMPGLPLEHRQVTPLCRRLVPHEPAVELVTLQPYQLPDRRVLGGVNALGQARALLVGQLREILIRRRVVLRQG